MCLAEELDDDKSRKLAAAAYGAFTGNLAGEDVSRILLDTVLGGTDGGIDEFASWSVRYGHALLLSAVVKHGLPKLVECKGGEGKGEEEGAVGGMAVIDQIIEAVQRLLEDERAPIRATAVDAVGGLLCHGATMAELGGPAAEGERMKKLLPELAAVLGGGGSNDSRRAAIRAVKRFAKMCPEAMADSETQAVLIPAVMVCVKDKNVMIKLAAERAALHVLQMKDGTPSAVSAQPVVPVVEE